MKIIAFGDSLTVGYQYPEGPAPYASFLASRLPDHTSIAVAATSGETTHDMLLRFGRDVVRNPPGIVVILGGTNDLGWGVPIDQIIQNLSLMYRQALEAKVLPVASTIPSILGADDHILPRTELNRKITQTAEALRIPSVDFFTATADTDGRLLAKYASDGLHLNAKGYEEMAQVLYETVLKELVSK